VQIPQGTVADVRLGGDTVRAYTGAFVLTDVQAGRLAGRITGRAAPLEIHYKLPGNAVLADARQTGTLTLVLQDDIEGVSLRRKVALLAGRSPLLFWLSDGGDRPYNRVFEELPLRVRQQPPGADSLSAVAITFGRETFTLRRGGRRQARGVDGRVVEFYLLSSYWTRAADVATAEGDAYHVMLLAWRPQG
jgi:hypothetical protein